MGRKPDGRATNGGARPGSGRRPGQVTSSTRKLAMRVLREMGDDAVTPFQVMMENMNFWRDRAEQYETLLRENVIKIEDPVERREVYSLIRELMRSREHAEECAVDAAPYLHPRISSIEFRGGFKDEDIPKQVENGQDLRKAIENYAVAIDADS